MPLVDDEPSDETAIQRVYSFLHRSLNFYRVHILYLYVVPHSSIIPPEFNDFSWG